MTESSTGGDAAADSGNPLAPLATVAGTAALALTLSLPLLQADGASRLFLDPSRLRAKRRKEQLYQVDKSLELKGIEMRAAVQNGGLGGTWRFNPQEDRVGTELLVTDEEVEGLVEQIMDVKSDTSKPVVVTIELDPDDERAEREWYLFLAFPPPPQPSNDQGDDDAKPTTTTAKKWRRVQVPLIPFSLKLAETFDSKMTSTALCFVADASSGLASAILASVLDKCGAGVAVVREPAWLMSVSSMIEKGVVGKDKMERVLFALCRLVAWSARDEVGESRTVVITLPGQSTTPTLIPLLQRAFPHERHVFAYDSCSDCVSRGLMLRKTLPRTLPAGASLKDVASMSQAVSATVPITPLRSIRKLGDALAKLPTDKAGIVEAWMASIDAFLTMKADEKTNYYTPFVCRMGFLMGRAGTLGNGAEDCTDLALTNVLQYVTGSRSRPLGEGVVDAAKAALLEIRAQCSAAVERYDLSERDGKVLEECTFLHHGILIGDKTLLDTVQPAQEWSLKAAKKLTSCACCAPEDEEDDEEEEEQDGRGGGAPGAKVDMSMPGAFVTGLSQRPGAATAGKKKSNYVDGKAAFAFDPSKFS